MTKLRHYDNLETARWITFSCFHRHRYLSCESNVRPVLEQVHRLREKHDIKVLGYVVMPEHMHLVLYPPDGLKLGRVIGQLKGLSARAILDNRRVTDGRAGRHGSIIRRPNGQPVVWQKRCFDHNCRTTDFVVEKINYCHNNPVARGLVDEPGDWPWSSYRYYLGESDVSLEIDAMGHSGIDVS